MNYVSITIGLALTSINELEKYYIQIISIVKTSQITSSLNALGIFKEATFDWISCPG